MSALFPSRYLYSETITDGTTLLAEDPRLEKFRFKEREDNLQVTVFEGERLWHIAHRLYPNNPRAGELYWVIAVYNNIADPTLELEPGIILYAPSNRVLAEELFGFED